MSPALREVHAGDTFAHDGERLLFPAVHLSLVIPRQCTGAALLEDIFQIARASPPMEAMLYLHEAGRHLVKSWLDEPITERQETMRPTGPARTADGVTTREFASSSYRGCRVKLDDIWGNGVSAIFRGPAKEAARLTAMIARVVDSVRFIRREPLGEQEVVHAIAAFLNARAANRGDLALYIDRHFYMVRDEVMEGFRLFTEQARREGHVAADVAAERGAYLAQARESIDRGSWDMSMADVRKARRP